jgi:hypothetical protein
MTATEQRPIFAPGLMGSNPTATVGAQPSNGGQA